MRSTLARCHSASSSPVMSSRLHTVHAADARRLIHVHRAIEQLRAGSDYRDVDAVPGHRA